VNPDHRTNQTFADRRQPRAGRKGLKDDLTPAEKTVLGKLNEGWQ